MKGRLVVPDVPRLRELFDEAHRARCTVHPHTTKMYKDLKKNFWWKNTRNDVAEYVSKCFTCQQVKAEHRKLVGTLYPLPILEWKWENISMNFIVGLPRTRKVNNSIWVIVAEPMKSAHFLPVKTTYFADILGRIYIQEIGRLHGIPDCIVLD